MTEFDTTIVSKQKDALDSIQYLARLFKKEGSEPVHYSTAEPSITVF